MHGLVDGRPVPVGNSHCAVFTTTPDGVTWIRKRELDSGPQPLVAEALGWRLARQLSVPVPPAAIGEPNGELSWLSYFLDGAMGWDETRADRLSNPDDLGAILALDAIILNEDRHAANILCLPDENEYSLSIVSIDTGAAWIGWPDDYARRVDDIPSVQKLAAGLPVDACQAGARDLALRAAQLSPDLLRDAAWEALDIVERLDQLQVLTQTLVRRCASAPQLVTAYLEAIEASQ